MAHCDLEALESPVQTLAMGRGEGLKFEPHIADAAPPDDRLLNKDRRLTFRKREQEIDLHAGIGFERAFEAAAFP